MFITDKLYNIYYLKKREGFKRLLSVIIKETRDLLFSFKRFSIYSIPVSPIKKAPDSTGDIRIRKADVRDLPLFETLLGPSKCRLFKRRLERDRVCFIAINDDGIVGYVWISFEVTPDLEGVSVELQKNQAYCYNLYTLPHWRRRGILKGIMKQVQVFLNKNGYKEIVEIIDSSNLPSIRQATKSHGKLLEKIRYLRILGYTKSKIARI